MNNLLSYIGLGVKNASIKFGGYIGEHTAKLPVHLINLQEKISEYLDQFRYNILYTENDKQNLDIAIWQ